MLLKPEDFIQESLSVYIHFPFCKLKCLYCDFYSNVFPYTDYVRYLIKEIELYYNLFGSLKVNTIYIGGGTPSLISLKDLSLLFDSIKKFFDTSGCKEITIEVNPESFNKQSALFYKEIGINRISIGAQSFDDIVLKKIGRIADSKKNIEAIELAKSIFTNVNIDIIYGIPGQDIKKEVSWIRSFLPDHVSAYCLTISKGTPIYKLRKSFKLPDGMLNYFFCYLHKTLKSMGYLHYEISNYALPGKESLHNKNYWDLGFYLGLGAGASGYIAKDRKYRYVNHRLKNYKKSIDNGLLPIKYKEFLGHKEILTENVMLGLRTSKGIKIDVFDNPKKSLLYEKIRDFVDKKYVKIDNDYLLPTLKGWCVIDKIVLDLISFI